MHCESTWFSDCPSLQIAEDRFSSNLTSQILKLICFIFYGGKRTSALPKSWEEPSEPVFCRSALVIWPGGVSSIGRSWGHRAQVYEEGTLHAVECLVAAVISRRAYTHMLHRQALCQLSCTQSQSAFDLFVWIQKLQWTRGGGENPPFIFFTLTACTENWVICWQCGLCQLRPFVSFDLFLCSEFPVMKCLSPCLKSVH